MKKDKFVQGAMIATVAIFISRFLGIVYVIPFYAVIGNKGGALFSYAYSLYSIFLALSTMGFPLAISKLTSEYDTLGDYHLKERAFKIAKRTLFVLSIISFAILVIFAPQIAHVFVGDIKGGNSISDVAFAIRMVSTALLIVPALSVTRGYLQGHKFITPPSISQVVEQVVRIVVVLGGSYLCMYYFHAPLRVTVGISVFAATVGGVAAYLYLLRKIKTSRADLRQNSEEKREETKVTNKDIIRRLIKYSIPFIFSSLVTSSLYNFVDLATMNKTMVHLGYTMSQAENVVGIVVNWTTKLNMIVMSVGMGLTTSLLPNITDSFVKRDFSEINLRINKAIQLLLYIIIPLTAGIILLGTPLWTFFYGFDTLGVFIFRYTMVVAFVVTLLQILIIIFQSTNNNKKLIYFLLVGLGIKIIFQVPLMQTFYHFGIDASYGAITSAVLGFSVSSFLILLSLHRQLKVNYEPTFKKLFDITIATVMMAIVMLLCQFILPIGTHSRIMSVILICIYAIIGIVVYIFVTSKNGLLKDVFGEGTLKKILIKLKLKKIVK